MVTIEKQLLTMSEAELETFPLGIIELDRSGKILLYNAAESVLAHRSNRQSVGLNFFGEVAPCTAVREFQGRFDEFVATRTNLCEEFRFVFRFAWGDREVGITLVRRPDDLDRTFIVVSEVDFNRALVEPSVN